MARCACGTATCSCVIKAVPGGGIVVVGNGSPTRPYQIAQEGGGNPLLNLDVVDTPSLDLTISGAGTLTDKRVLTGVAHPSMRELRDVDAADVPASGDVPTWNGTKWVFSPPSAASVPVSGVWGTAPLDTAIYGSDSLLGRETYLDSAGKLRAKPDIIDGAIAVHPVTALPTTYPTGVSVMYVGVADGATWPSASSAVVVTAKTTNHGCVQWCYPPGTAAAKGWVRTGTSSVWSPWEQVVGKYNDGAICTGSVTLSTTSLTDITGMNLAVPVPGPSSVFQVITTFDVQLLATAAGTFIGQLTTGPTLQQQQAIWTPANASVSSQRSMVSQTHRITGLAAGTHTFKAQASCAVANQFRINGSHSTLVVTQIA